MHEERRDEPTDLRYQFSHGDVDRAWRRGGGVVVEGTYRLNFVTPACLGTMVAIADWDPQGRLTMWSTTQVPFLYQRDLAEALGITGDRIRVHAAAGRRQLRPRPRPLSDRRHRRAAGAAARRPVKIEFERVEEFVACPTREPCTIRLRTAADADGRLLGRDCHVVIDNGAYVSWGSTTPYVMLSTVAGLYRCPNVRFDTTIAYTNNPTRARCAATATLESTFAVEAQMDELADRLGLDRLARSAGATRRGPATSTRRAS